MASNLVIILLLVLIIWGAYYLFSLSKNNRQSKKSFNPNAFPSNADRKLLRLVGGDRKYAARILNQLSQKYPGKSHKWYLEKAIYDLERDRGVY